PRAYIRATAPIPSANGHGQHRISRPPPDDRGPGHLAPERRVGGAAITSQARASGPRSRMGSSDRGSSSPQEFSPESAEMECANGLRAASHEYTKRPALGLHPAPLVEMVALR